ncbi:hypothetical protein MLD38_003249 [Melastoma candidum]|uniref:Uncharacterized protein n=1 Tax=Melastoma candidum TaxID=119954 RepID=A0ACB9S200_9MYRT|nr:hypothetical protein MLD38_003249 [Melastoma candidum]
MKKAELELPAGFRFHPTDDELVNHYLIRKCAGHQVSAPIIADIDLYKFDPWQLPDMALYGEKDWLANVDRSAGKKNNLRLDEWVLCRIYNKKGRIEKHYPSEQKPGENDFPEVEEKPASWMLNQNYYAALPPPPPPAPKMSNDTLHMDTSESVPKLHTESSCSGHVLSPDLTADKEVQSVPKWNECDNSFDVQFGSMDSFLDGSFATPQGQYQLDGVSPFQDMFMGLQKPF